MEPDEALGNSPRETRVHRESLAGPVAARADALELADDLASVGLLPFPHMLEKLFASDRAAVNPLLGQLALDKHLGRDACMVRTRQPKDVVSLHSLPAHGDVDLGGLEHMPHV